MTRRQGDKETRRQGDGATGRRGDGATGRLENKEARSGGDKEARSGDMVNLAPSPRLPVAPSPRLPIAPSPRRLLLFLFVSAWFAFPIAGAQTGEITGRVVTEDGAGAPNVMVFLNAGAVEVKAAAGEEVSGIDIRRRGDRGRAISGVVKGGGETETT